MIKIIKKGTRDIRECESCGCLFSFDEEDILGGKGLKKYIKCPQCKMKIILKTIRATQLIESEEDCIDCKYGPFKYGVDPCVSCNGDMWEAKEIPDKANCSNCVHVNDTDYREKCNKCGSENFFKYWKGVIENDSSRIR